MKWMGLNELREKYLSFFESKGHLRLDSFSLVPQGDKSLLLINSGMAPMKKYFTGEVTPPRKRVTTCQKCIRTPDIENVGKTARHGTYFEMLGNFSFGDYFKHEATAWAWEFCTKVIEMPVDRLWITIYEDDDEAFDIWTKEVGVSPDRIVRMGKADNFWEHGSGPCGPCSELHFDRGEKYGCGKPDCKVGCECDRFTEFWNLVFTQFDNDGNGNYTRLDHPNIDTGMGLERLACIVQDVNNIFEIDTMQNIMSHIARIADKKYHDNEKDDISLRVITDHIRSTTFMVGDGVLPSNEGRGYVLRRLLRRAARHGRLLGIDHPFLADVAKTVIENNKNAYPALAEKVDFITKVISNEEENFSRTIDTGLQLLEEVIAKSGDSKTISGEDAFRLYDTYGFPLDLTKEIAEEKGLHVDEEGFTQLMSQQRIQARNARKDAGADAWKASGDAGADFEATEFTGYGSTEGEGKILGVIVNGERTESYEGEDEFALIADKTPFYGESGGQAGDTGVIKNDSFTAEVLSTSKNAGGVFVHSCHLVSGTVKAGETASFEVDKEKRFATMRNHTAAHLLQAALRKVLGSHVEQAGQLVNSAEVRFDFSHFSALTPEELKSVEALVNEKILAALTVTTTEMPIDEAKKKGAMALFGEKYGDVVRVVEAGDFSVELCGGTHVDNTSKLGLFKIISESSVASGVRRIQAVTGAGVLEFIEKNLNLINESCAALKLGNPADLARRCRQVSEEVKAAEKKVTALENEKAELNTKRLLENYKTVGEYKLIAANIPDAAPDALRRMCDSAKNSDEAVVIILASEQKAKSTVSLAAACSKAAVNKGAHAGNIVREAAKACGGSGGGKPDSAMAGGKDPSKIDEALNTVEKLLS